MGHGTCISTYIYTWETSVNHSGLESWGPHSVRFRLVLTVYLLVTVLLPNPLCHSFFLILFLGYRKTPLPRLSGSETLFCTVTGDPHTFFLPPRFYSNHPQGYIYSHTRLARGTTNGESHIPKPRVCLDPNRPQKCEGAEV